MSEHHPTNKNASWGKCERNSPPKIRLATDLSVKHGQGMSETMVLNDAVASPPLKPRRPNTFTTANAREMAAKALAARIANRNRPPPQPEPPKHDQTAGQPLNPLYGLVLAEIERVRETLEGKLDPKDRAQLVRALDLLLDRERIYRDRPLPGSRRPAPERVARPASDLPTPT